MKAADVAPVMSTFTNLSMSESPRTRMWSRPGITEEEEGWVDAGLNRFSGVETDGEVEGRLVRTVSVGGCGWEDVDL